MLENCLFKRGFFLFFFVKFNFAYLFKNKYLPISLKSSHKIVKQLEKLKLSLSFEGLKLLAAIYPSVVYKNNNLAPHNLAS
jgi:hypothetical protein